MGNGLTTAVWYNTLVEVALDAAVSVALLDTAASVVIDVADPVALEEGGDEALTTWMVW